MIQFKKQYTKSEFIEFLIEDQLLDAFEILEFKETESIVQRWQELSFVARTSKQPLPEIELLKKLGVKNDA